jgi:hypothetical protein
MLELTRVSQFNLFDLDQDGKIDIVELKTACRALGFDFPKEELKATMAQYGTVEQEPIQGQSQQLRPGRRKAYLNQANFELFVCLPPEYFFNLPKS